MDLSLDVMAGGVQDDTVRVSIVHAALRLAEQAGSWDAVHVHAVAREAGMSLEELRRHFGDKDAIAGGFFDIADAALLACFRRPGWGELAIRERLYRAITAWLDALAPHQRTVAGMLGYKLHPEHVHLQVRGVARISRTAQWIRETAMLPSVGWRRELEEAVITTIYLTTFSRWLMDRSPGTESTRSLLRRLLAVAERGALRLGFSAHP
ncbi:MAG: TetR family transcriptional regulator [Ramlibacter sp.]|nr:TetR family transcriptional regulator [Ramlibacter sp.]